MKRNLSGIFFRSGSDNIVFEELSTKEKKIILSNKSREWIEDLAIQLSNTISRIGDELDVVVGDDYESM
jgi:hypothetical protein